MKSTTPRPYVANALLKVLERKEKKIDGHSLKECYCRIDKHLDPSLYVWNPPESPWYYNEGCHCFGTGWVCAECGGQGWVGGRHGATTCTACRKEIRVEIDSEDANGKARTVLAVKIIDADWVAPFRHTRRA